MLRGVLADCLLLARDRILLSLGGHAHVFGSPNATAHGRARFRVLRISIGSPSCVERCYPNRGPEGDYADASAPQDEGRARD